MLSFSVLLCTLQTSIHAIVLRKQCNPASVQQGLLPDLKPACLSWETSRLLGLDMPHSSSQHRPGHLPMSACPLYLCSTPAG